MNNFLPNFNFQNIDTTATNLLVCPDQYVTMYTPSTGQISSRTYINIDYGYDVAGNVMCNNLKSDTMVIVLESPHKDEYCYANGVLVPKGPLVSSWNDFQKLFHNAIQGSAVSNAISNASTYDIAFVNAVQYQCSLGKTLYKNKNNKKQKNTNVINSWYSGFSGDLEKRLIALNPSIIIDLSGESQIIHKCIANMIVSLNLKAKFTYGIHPSCWIRNYNKGKALIK